MGTSVVAGVDASPIFKFLEGFFESQPLDLAAKGNLAVSVKADNVENFLANIAADRCQRGRR
jgi:hypothetical protein